MRAALASGLLAATLSLAACGGGSGTAASSSHSDTSTSVGTSTVATNAASGNGSSTTGNGSSAPGNGSSARSGGVLVARHGGFRTIVPSGFTPRSGGEASIEYWVSRPNPSGRATSVTVFRAVAHTGDLRAVASSAVQRLEDQPALFPKADDISALTPTQVGGRPALYMDYKVAGRKPSERRQVFVLDGEWTYEISDSAAPTEFAASLGALEEVIDNWRWQ